MAETKRKSQKLALDVLIVAVGVAFILLAGFAGGHAGHTIEKGTAAVLGGLYVIYLGALFLLSYFFSEASYVLSFLMYICEECSRGRKGRHMAFVYFALSVGFGAWLLLFGLGVF